MAVGFGVDALGVEAEVFGEGVEEGTLLGLHWLEAESLFFFVCCKDAEFAFLGLGEFGKFAEEVECCGGVGDMVVSVSSRIDVQRRGELSVALKLEAFVIAIEDFARVARGGLGGEAFDWLFLMLTDASDERLCLAGLDFFARVRSMTWVRACVFADCLLTVAWLSTGRRGVFALAGTVAGLLAGVNTALEFLAARQTAANFCEPAWLILQRLLTTNAWLLNQERTFRTVLRIVMALMLDLRMATSSSACTFK